MKHHLRIARPVTAIARTQAMYCQGLGLKVLGSFTDHQGFDGVMLGRAGMDYHFEFTHCTLHAVKPGPTPEDLVVFYQPDEAEWRLACEAMAEAGFRQVASFNPYWDVKGKTFEDCDGYRIVLKNASWVNTGSEG